MSFFSTFLRLADKVGHKKLLKKITIVRNMWGETLVDSRLPFQKVAKSGDG